MGQNSERENALDPADLVLEEDAGLEPPHETSITGAAADALETGLAPIDLPDQEIPGQDQLLRAGDPDVDPLDPEYSGESVPGGGHPTPDQNGVDDIGRLYGVTNTDDGELQLGDDLVKRRDEHRWELDPASKED